ncbi:AAA family ATPase [[Kitasatospora] papulosa]|uniref:AAA family ATPase n=1 Tax=[Kitasatospora] papulosa TaxID=1464011 RepID=UPI0036CA33A5
MNLVGRAAVIDAGAEVLTECEAGEFRTLFVEGPAGCGKSAVVDAVADLARAAGAVVLGAVGSPAERDAPLGVLRQMVCSDPAVAQPALTADPDHPARTEAMQDFCLQLRELAEDGVVLLYVDDAQYADDLSVQYLQHLARHARASRVLLLVAVSPYTGRYPELATELMRQPGSRRFRLGCLSPAETAEAAGRPSPGDHLHAVTGGNPLLLRALLAEPAGPDEGPLPQEPASERCGPFSQAVVTCVQRSGPAAPDVALAAAVLNEFSSPELVRQLLGIAPAAVDRDLAALRAAGLLTGARFRHSAARAAVLDAASGRLRAALHRRAALLLDRDGVAATAVAGQLLAAATHAGDVPWHATQAETDVLREAAEDLLSRDEARQAVRLLELALEVCPDEQQRAAVRIRLARLTWRFSPAAAERRLADLLNGPHPGIEHAQPLVQLLLAHGRVPDAARLLDGQDPAAVGASLVDTAFATGTAGGERLLQETRLTDATVEPITQALRALVHSDHPERAVPWGRNLLREAERRGAPGWSAVFASLLAEALLRMGDLRGACAHAQAALDHLPERTGCTLRFAPTAVLVRARTLMGESTEAARLVDQPGPRHLFSGMYGLGFLRARGLHLLACHQPQAALADFMEIGHLMEQWGVDRPALLPWRTDAAEALLRLGHTQRAEELALQQLALPDARRPWVRGVSLRMRALVSSSAKQRVTLLTQAVDELHRSGDRLEAARAMAELGQAMQSEGTAPAKGSALIRTAWNLAKECEAGTLCREILPDAPLSDAGTDQALREPDAARSAARLSTSEQRVATLAAQGLTNREISAKLYLTVSTVEQHLTRVYRKLQISCRGELPVNLAMGSGRPVDW